MSESKRPSHGHNTTPTAAKKARGATKERDDSFKIDIDALSRTWSPHRLLRTEKKVRSLEDGNLQGGDFVLNSEGIAATLSFLFEKSSKVYGLTVGHLADVDDSVFCFMLSSPTPNSFDDGASFELMELGPVVSKDVETDSLIFEIIEPYLEGRVDGRVDILKIAAGAGLGDRTLILPSPEVNPAPPRQKDSKVIVYGAMRRGECGRVAVPWNPAPGLVSKEGDIGIGSLDDERSRRLSADGDCGALYLDEQGRPFAIHHALRGLQAPYLSFGIPLASIMAKHPLLGGSEEAHETQQTSGSLLKHMKGAEHERRNLAKFDTKITRAVASSGDSSPEEMYESRNMAHFDVKLPSKK